MNKTKTCFFEKISTIELAFQADLLSNHIHMGGKNTLAATAIAVALTTTSPAFSENSDSLTKDAITCETKLACQKLTDSIQAQIDELDKSDDPDFDKLEALQIQLIAVEKSETEKNTNLIATEKSETTNIENTILAQENSKDSLDFLKQEQASIRGALLEN